MDQGLHLTRIYEPKASAFVCCTPISGLFAQNFDPLARITELKGRISGPKGRKFDYYSPPYLFYLEFFTSRKTLTQIVCYRFCLCISGSRRKLYTAVIIKSLYISFMSAKHDRVLHHFAYTCCLQMKASETYTSFFKTSTSTQI